MCHHTLGPSGSLLFTIALICYFCILTEMPLHSDLSLS